MENNIDIIDVFCFEYSPYPELKKTNKAVNIFEDDRAFIIIIDAPCMKDAVRAQFKDEKVSFFTDEKGNKCVTEIRSLDDSYIMKTMSILIECTPLNNDDNDTRIIKQGPHETQVCYGFAIPRNTDIGKIKAEWMNGALKITIPFADSVQINSAGKIEHIENNDEKYYPVLIEAFWRLHIPKIDY